MAAKKIDQKELLTGKTVAQLKGSTPIVNELIRQTTAYAQQCEKTVVAGRKLADALQKVGELPGGDMQQGFVRLADALRAIEAQRDLLVKALRDGVVPAMSEARKPDENDVTQFEAAHKRQKAQQQQDIERLEAATRKAGKKNPAELQKCIAALGDRIKLVEVEKSEKLRSVLLLERKKYATIVQQWLPAIGALTQLTAAHQTVNDGEPEWRALAESQQQIPESEYELLLMQQKRTFLPIQPDLTDSPELMGGGGGGSVYNLTSSNSFGAYQQHDGGDLPPPPDGLASYGDAAPALPSSGSFRTTTQQAPGGGGGSGRFGMAHSGSSGYGGYPQQQQQQQRDDDLPPPPPEEGGEELGTATALYDYVSSEENDLSFRAGATLTIVRDDSGGWTCGRDAQGNVGIFPTSYVRRDS